MRKLKLFLNVTVTSTMLLALSTLEAQPQPTTSTSSFEIRGGGGSIEYPQGWSTVHYANVNELWNTTPERLAGMSPDEREEVARIKTSVTPCANHSEALHRLREIERNRE